MLRHASIILCAAFTSLTALGNVSPGPDGFFISIDGIDPEYVDLLTDSGTLQSPYGLGWLSKNSAFSKQAKPIEVSLTAASHISTITCTPPSRHGIVANGFLTGGESVSGFTHPFRTEPLWVAAARQGKKVLSLAYAGADGRAPERFADFGIAYPQSSYVSKDQTIESPLADLAVASGWEAGMSLQGALETTVELLLNPKSGETRQLNVLVVSHKDGRTVYIDADKNLNNGVLAELSGQTIGHMYFTEQDESSDLFGYRRTAFATLLPADTDTLKMFVSGSSYNNAYPASYREALDQANLVWPDYGISGDNLSVEQYIAGQSLIDRFLTDVAVFSSTATDVDIVLFYQPLVDSVGHKYEGQLPQPLDPAGQDYVTRTYVAAYQVIDENMSKLYGAYKDTAVINLMGDHGMDPIKKVVNLAALLPENVRLGVTTETSGALVMLYDSQLRADFNAGEVIREKLASLTFEGDLVVGENRDRRDYVLGRSVDYKKEWQHGDADWAFLAGHKFWFRYLPNESEVFVEPPIYGMHGHPIDLPSMGTGYYFRAPGVNVQDLGPMSLIDAVPTFMSRLGLQAPSDCLGSALSL